MVCESTTTKKTEETICGNTSNFVYVRSKEHSWVPARVLETKEKEAIVQLLNYRDEQSILSCNDGRIAGSVEMSVQLNDYPAQSLPLQNVNEDGSLIQVEDMVDLSFLHEAAILYNLKSRHLNGLPYTRTGDIVIAVNPYQWFSDLYTEQRRHFYSTELVWKTPSDQDPRKNLAPHVYEVSALAYRGLALEQQNQSILVSGESGAGKTETVKICLNHIASIQRGYVAEANVGEDSTSTIVQRVLDSNPLLEAFGNAKTMRNDNSSRFGKFIQLQFDGEDPSSIAGQGNNMPRCVLAGSKCEVYLLEKSRVVHHCEEERTYHIFYQLLAASEETKAAIWDGLVNTDNESFSYVGWSETSEIEGISDRERFAQTIESLELIGVGGDKLKTLMRSVCTVLQLGNLIFEPHPADSDRSIISSDKEFAMLADLMGIAPKDLEKAFTERTIEARGEVMKTPLTADKATDARDAFAKEIYSRSFLWLVREINDATCAEKNYEGNRRMNYGTIGLLDIFGFESFRVNGFEQLCINYANEKLQQKFTEDIFRTVQEEYHFEGIELDEITYDDNSDVLELIEGRMGLLNVLNEECFRPSGNDASFVSKALLANKQSPCLVAESIFHQFEFGIRHYAGEVVYHAECFVVKNTDNVPSDLKEAAKKSSNDIISKYLDNDTMMNSIKPRRPVHIHRRTNGTHAQPMTARSNKGRTMVGTTVWTKFKTQLSSLMEKLGETRTRYIRCIKPNTLKEALLMNHSSTVEQLRCAGVVAAVTISRSAFPNRLEHRAVLERFKSLWPKEAGRSEECNIEERSKTDVDTLLTSALNDLEVKKGEKTIKAFVIGRSRAYFRAGALEFLENKRLDGMTFWAVEIQKTIRGFLERRRFQKKGQASVRIEAQVRRFLAKRHYEQLRQRTTQLQSWFRCLHAKRVLVLKRTFSQATKIQVQWKIHKARANLRMHQQAASTIQRFARGMIQRPKYRRALQDKKDESDMKKRLEKRQRELEEAELRAKEEIEQERKEARRQIEEERMKLFEDKRARKLEQEQRESKMEKDLQELKELVALQAKMASQSGHVNNVSPKNSAGEPEVKVVEVVKYVEKGMDNAGPIMTQEQQALMEESGKIIEFLRKENTKLRKKNEVMRNDFKALKENNQRLMEANASAGQSFTALNDHAKQLNGTNQKLLKTVAQYKQKIAQLNGDMNSRQSYYREIASAYKTESEVRAFYEKAILDIFDMASSDRSLTSLQNMVRAKAAECAAVSKRLAVSAPDLEESDSSS